MAEPAVPTPMSLRGFDFRRRIRAAGIHLLLSLGIACLAALLVFVLWYPGAFRLLAGGRDLFFLVTSVDVVMGPVLTFAVFNLAKGWPHLRRDLYVIGLLQSAALVYGLHTVYAVRPVAMAFEVDRLRLIAATDVNVPELPKAMPMYRQLPLTGPWLLGTRSPAQGQERNDAIFMGLKGIDVSQRPQFWQPYDLSAPDVVKRSRPVSALTDHYTSKRADIESRLHDMAADPSIARFLPVMARGNWVAVLDPAAHILGYMPYDGFIP